MLCAPRLERAELGEAPRRQRRRRCARFLRAQVALDEPRYRGRAADVIRYVRGSLSDAAGDAFFASEQATVDPAIYAAGNACMVSAFLRASEVLGDVSLMDCAIAVLERVAGETYRRADGVAHRVDDPTSVSGLLADQVALAEAFLDAYHATDREVYADLAQELMLFAMRRLWHERAAVFVDRAPAADDIGLLQQDDHPVWGELPRGGRARETRKSLRGRRVRRPRATRAPNAGPQRARPERRRSRLRARFTRALA